MFWYVLFAKTGHEEKAVKEINRLWQIENLITFIPMYDAKFRKQGKLISEKRKLFPGYVFIETEISGSDFYTAVRDFISRSKYLLKLLSNCKNHGDSSSFEMTYAERENYLEPVHTIQTHYSVL